MIPPTLILRAALVWATCTALGFFLGPMITEAMLPLYRLAVDALMPYFAAQLRVVEPAEGARQIQMLATVIRPLPLTPEVTVPVGRQVPASITVLHSMVPAVVLMTLALAWPVHSASRLLVRATLALVASLVVLLLVNPAHMVGNLEIGLQGAIEQMGGDRPEPWVIRWMLLMEGGGRWALAIVAATLCISVSDLGRSGVNETGAPAPTGEPGP